MYLMVMLLGKAIPEAPMVVDNIVHMLLVMAEEDTVQVQARGGSEDTIWEVMVRFLSVGMVVNKLQLL